MSEEKNKKSVLFEDLQMGSNNYMGVGKGPGQSAMTLKPQKVTLLDLIKQAKNWEEEMGKAPNRLPYPLQDGLSEQIGDLYVKTVEIRSKVAESAKYSIIKDNESAYKSVKNVHTKLSKICEAIKDVVADLDGLSVGTATDEFHA
ncbi:MAG: hypothetical protein EBY39_07910 [Flavobacteriia bacterium]|nr:hypothetical protein [Flavobacteriia bacterium]